MTSNHFIVVAALLSVLALFDATEAFVPSTVRSLRSLTFLTEQSSASNGGPPSSSIPLNHTGTTATAAEPVNGAVASDAAAPTPPTFDATSLLAIDPSQVSIHTLETPVLEQVPSPNTLKRLPFVNMFRGSASYIANHRNTLAVYHIPGGLLDLPDPSLLRDLMNDIALSWLLGMKIVLVVGCRHQMDKRLPNREKSHGLRVTDQDSLRIVKEEAGYVRFEVERQLARSLRMQGGGTLGNKHGYYDGNVVSGNFYSAQPFGVLDGVDYK